MQQLNNYTKNPLLVRVFHELAWVEDMGSGTRNILRYAPLYYPNYKVEIDSGSQFIFSITYLEMSPKNEEMSQEKDENVPRNLEMSPKNEKMSQEKEMDDDLDISLKDNSLVNKKTIAKRHKRQQGIIGLIKQNPNITMEEMAEKLDVNERTIKRDLEDLKNVVVHIGPTKRVIGQL